MASSHPPQHPHSTQSVDRHEARAEMHRATGVFKLFAKQADVTLKAAAIKLKQTRAAALKAVEGHRLPSVDYHRLKGEVEKAEKVLKGFEHLLKGWEYGSLAYEAFLAEHSWERSRAQGELKMKIAKESIPIWVGTAKELSKLMRSTSRNATWEMLYRIVGKRVMVLWKLAELPLLVVQEFLESTSTGVEIFDIAYGRGWDLEDGQQVVWETLAQLGDHHSKQIAAATSAAIYRVSEVAAAKQKALEDFEKEIAARRQRPGGLGFGSRPWVELN
jgi:hypothetical protein